MNNITVAAYAININILREKEDKQTLSDFANGNDLFDFLKTYIGNWHESSESDINLIDDISNKKVLRLVDDSFNPFGRQISGIIESGAYGYKADIIDTQNGIRVHTKDLNHAEMLPFYFKIFIPKDSENGILLLQRFKQFGIYSTFKKVISRKFITEFANYRIHFTPLVSDEIIDDFISRGKLKKVTLKKLNLTPEILEKVDKGTDANGNFGRIEYSIVANRGQELPFMKMIRKAMRSGEKTMEGLFSIRDFEYNKVSVSVNLNGHSRTLDLSSLSNVGAFFDVTKHVSFNPETGHPTLESIREESRKILEDLIKVTKKTA